MLSFVSLDTFQANQGKSVLIWTDSAFPAESHSFREAGTACPAHRTCHALPIATCPTQSSVQQGQLLRGDVSQALRSTIWNGNVKSSSSQELKK